MREWRKTHSVSAEQMVKVTARHVLRVYKKRGVVVARPCSKCQAEKVEAHHPDYSKPLEAEWMCRPHHLELHEEQKKSRPWFYNLKPGKIYTSEVGA